MSLPGLYGHQSADSPSNTYPLREALVSQTFLPSHYTASSSTSTAIDRDSFRGQPSSRLLRTSILTSTPEEPRTTAVRVPLNRLGSQLSIHSGDSNDVAMDDDEEAQAGSDNESNDSDSTRPTKKKKGQKFFCTDFPPCNLSFTRSEHLARHIRKHTGERPFQCHCMRRFSRLDNLRQHAQTVHVNEEIPGDSLAATGTRFQRQIRTDRVRPPGNRVRPATINGQPSLASHARIHGRTLSNSSLGSSAASDFCSVDDPRRRPTSLTMPFDAYGHHVTPSFAYGPHRYSSPSGFSTPSSAYSAANPLISSGPTSPPTTTTHGNRPITWGGRLPPRRVSASFGQSTFTAPAPYSSLVTTSYTTPVTSSAASTFSTTGSSYTSPSASVYPAPPPLPSATQTDDANSELRRRTWHPSTYKRQPSSGLSYFQTPDVPAPMPSAPPAVPGVRLPGIDSFDLAGAQPIAPPRRAPSPMDVDEPSIAEVQPSLGSGPSRPPPVAQENSWDLMQNNLHKLDLTRAPPAQVAPAIMELVAAHQNSHHPPPSSQQERVRGSGTTPLDFVLNKDTPPEAEEAQITPRNRKRQAWYNGPLPGAGAASNSGHVRSASHASVPVSGSSLLAVPYRPSPSVSSNATEGYAASGTGGYTASTNASSIDDYHAKNGFRPGSAGGRVDSLMMSVSGEQAGPG